MSASKPSPRLTKIDRILSLSPPLSGRSATGDTDQLLLASVPLERIQALTLELQQRSLDDTDDLDALSMRVLLNDYRAAVASLRIVTSHIDARLHTASHQIHKHGKGLRRDEELAIKRAER
jgi:hypothetical protein